MMGLKYDRLMYLLLFLFLSGSIQAQLRLNVFYSFEDQEEISKLEVTEGIQIAQSIRYPTWKDHSLEAVFPTAGGSIEFSAIPKDWRQRSALLVFAWSEQPFELELSIEDDAGNRYGKTFGLRMGANHIQMDLRKVRSMQWKQMKTLRLSAPSSGILYLDFIALHDYNELLEDRGRFDFHLKTDIETEHFKWADPLDGGPIEVYALNGVIDGRAIIELAQRLEINFTSTTMGISQGMNFYGFGEFYQQRRGGLSLIHTYIADDLYNGPDFDVILWPALRPWESYPQEIRDEIRRQVEEEGKGLILFYPETRDQDGAGLSDISPLVKLGRGWPVWPEDQAPPDVQAPDTSAWKIAKEHFITRGLDLAAFPEDHLSVVSSSAKGNVLIQTEEGNNVLAVRRLGKGRVVAFAYRQRGMIPEVSNVWDTGLHYPYWDHMWSLVARATVWAAGREPREAIVGFEQNIDRIDLALTVNHSDTTVSGRLMDSEGRVLRHYDQPVGAGLGRVSLALPDSLPAGRLLLDLRLIGQDGSLDWGNLVLQKKPAAEIRNLALGGDRVQLGQSVTARVTLASSKSQDCRVVVGMYDNYDRLLDERIEELTLGGEAKRTFELTTAGAASHLARVRCRVEAGGVVQDRAEQKIFLLQKRVWDDFDIVMYLFGPDPMPGIWPVIDRQIRRMHVTTLSSYPVEFSMHANYMVQARTRVSGQESPDRGPDRVYYDEMKRRYLQTGDKRLLVRKYCLNDPAYRELIRRELKELATPWVPFSPLSYYVLEEPSLTTYGDAVDICFSRHCMREMREWLRDEYGSLEKLNHQWGTRFSTWDEVVPDDYKEAQARGNYSSWADHRTFMERTYANSYKIIYEELRKLDPNAVMLNSGTQDSASHNGCDYSLLNQYTLHLNAYQYEVHRSMNPAVKISGGAGYGVMGKYALRNFYRNLFKGANGGLYVFWQYCTIDPDLTLNQSARDMIRGFDELRGRGIGKLVGLANPDNHGIAVHYSYPSIHGTWIVDGQVKDRVTYDTSPSFDRFQKNTSGWLEILRDCGLQFDFIAARRIEAGQLIDKQYKTLVLPMSVALSDREIAEISRFVEAGGTLIADGLPGVMDQHCRFRTHADLDRILGVRTPIATAEMITAASGEPSLELAGAQAFLDQDGKPELILNEYGRGQAWLLNYFHHRYSVDKLDGTHHQALENLRLVLDRASIHPIVRLIGANGAPVVGCERYLFNNRTTRLLGLVPDMDRPDREEIEIRWEGERTVYDVRDSRYLGSGERLRTVIEAGVPRLFAFVSGRVTGLELEIPARARLGEEIRFDFRILGIDDFRSVTMVTVTDPNGKTRRIYGGNRNVENSAGKSSFRTALNDPAGEWLIEVRETVSGERAGKTVVVE